MWAWKERADARSPAQQLEICCCAPGLSNRIVFPIGLAWQCLEEKNINTQDVN
jgi:hypothetical protein